MYEAHFGLQEPPFALTPNTRYFLESPGHREALELLLVALREREGFVKVTGEVGTGKTLLCRMLLNALGDGYRTAYIPNPCLSADGLYEALADELSIALPDQANVHRVLKTITEHLLAASEQQQQVVLIIDEAQAMPEATLEALRLLTNLETETTRLLQVVLFGQPELDSLLAQQTLRQLRQRITFQYWLPPLDRQSAVDYLRHRLAQAGYRGTDLFSAAALRLITRASGGIPRLLNVLAHKALLVAWGQGVRQVRRRHVSLAIQDTESVTMPGLLARVL